MGMGEWQAKAERFVEMRRGLFAAREGEALVGYVGAYRPVYVLPGEGVEGETWFVWFVFPGEGYLARLVNMLVPGVYVDAQDGTVFEHDPAQVVVIGTVTRLGDQPLLSRDMLK